MGVKDTKMFSKFARKAFDEIDLDKTGELAYPEVCIGIMKIYDQLNAKFPAHVLSPKRTEMLDLCKKFDKDDSGTIGFDEFLEMAKVLVGSRSNFFESLPWKYGSVMFLRVVLCPIAAAYIIKGLVSLETPYAAKIPVAPLATVLEILIKLVAK